ncbi:SGNH/GDSL hydrolase family protein [Arsenicibacter rosenii]|uniref:SGNH hydrolase-type esterase domain-containing protein n=1 Tax=Arsenicibacter rosenii TaxID=1750698 RepID=A0A1S2VPA2_9BACT|nr:SGNH/GDSL hydrolase family protein [Arsenicibacter rosenii]OIN60572.1 hypothetical protein BLX24_00135 [Arsenicibacter rosenii]
MPITVKRLSNKSANNPNSDNPAQATLPAPAFNRQSGNVPYAATVQFSALDVPAGAVVEYSADGGTNWATGQAVTVLSETTILARTRLNNQVSATASAQYAPYFRRVFILGNSITGISPVPEIGWTGNWGMAASSADKDYVHLLTAQLKNRYADIQVKPIAGSSFERTWWTYDMSSSLDEHLPFDGNGPDLVIVRIGENMDDTQVEPQNLERYYRQLLDYLIKYSKGPVKVVCTTTFYAGQEKANAVIRKVAAEKGYPVADIQSLAGDATLRATQYSNAGLAQHPNDAGMQKIADLIWQVVK